MEMMTNVHSFIYLLILKYLVCITIHLGRVWMDRKWAFLEKTSEDPDTGSPWGALNEIELDVHSSMRSEPEFIHCFATGLTLTITNILHIVPHQNISRCLLASFLSQLQSIS